METGFQELKRKEVVNVIDGKCLGKVCDVVFTYPEGKVQGIVAPGGKGFRWGKPDLFIDVRSIQKIGIDTVLVEVRSAPKPPKKRGTERAEYCSPSPEQGRRDYGEYE